MLATLLLLQGLAAAPSPGTEIIRTAHGVPHIYAPDLFGAGFGLAWVQLEDYGARVAQGLLRARGEMGRLFGRDSLESDFAFRPERERARAAWPRLDQATRDVYAGFAAGLNRYVELHRGEFAEGFPTDFAGWDVLTRDLARPSFASVRHTLVRAGVLPPDSSRPAGAAPGADPPEGERAGGPPDADVGSNAWALAPSRTRSGRAILLRNPHLAWDAGYYEAHVTVPGVLDFYGDFRIGGPFTVIAGFNRDLGWATTNNAADQDEVYALEAAPGRTDEVLLDGVAVPLTREAVTAEYRNGPGFAAETRERWTSPLGPVVARAGGKVYILRSAGEGEFRAGEQFLRMMRARSLDEWKGAMRMHARATSNFTYADRAGNIFYVWNVTLPDLPHAGGGDSLAIPVARTRDAFTRLVPWDSLPQLLNPPGGYIHQENSSPHFTNLRAPLDPARFPPNVQPPDFSLRSQLGAALVGETRRKLSLEDVVRLKHSYRMLLAERVKGDLLAAARAAGDPALAEAIGVLAAWDNTAAPEARGAVLFETWWRTYTRRRGEPAFATPWTIAEPTTTPRGLASAERAVLALRAAQDTVRRRWGALDVPWGEVHRVRLGGKDVPVGGCGGALGCFRVLNFREEPDGKRAAQGGDGWVLAVEFGRDAPRAYSVLAYGQSNRPGSPWNGDQAELFARGEMKRVAWSRAEVEAQAVRRYRPGEPE